MFEQPTTLILGAGASWHYGYPTGIDLIKRVKEFSLEQAKIPITAEEIKKRPDFFKYEFSWAPRGSNNNIYWDAYSKKMNLLYEKLNTLNPLVIDYFLQENNDIADAGRYAIAHVLLECEEFFIKNRCNSNSLKYKAKNDQRAPSVYFQEQDDWYRFLLDKIVRGCRNVDDLCEKNFLDIITFNYDVSLEFRLYESLCKIKMFEGNENKIQNFISKMVFHVYGSLRDNYDIPDFTRDIYKSANEVAPRLKLVHPKSPVSNNGINLFHADSADKLKNSERIFFLGYGFDKNNSDYISIPSIFTSGTKIENISFINFENHNRINKIFSGILPYGEDTSITKTIYENGGGIFTFNMTQSDGKKSILWFEKSVRNVYEALEKDFVL